MYRDHTKVIQIGNRVIGGGNPILIQSMTNTRTEDVESTVQQILALEAAGCEIVRCTIPTLEAAKAIAEIKKRYGKNAILKGMNFEEAGTTKDRNEQIGGHRA